MYCYTKLNSYGEAILVNTDRAGSYDEAVSILNKYETACENIDILKSEYEWLLGLNDDELIYQVKTRNDVQNALIELLRLADDIADIYI